MKGALSQQKLEDECKNKVQDGINVSIKYGIREFTVDDVLYIFGHSIVLFKVLTLTD